MPPANRLPGLDALRGIAALLVVGLHAHAVFGGFPDWFGRGYLAVDFFVMLSGFLMARITESRLADGLLPARFMAARYRRFWPMMALGSAIGTPYLWVRADGLAQFLPVFAANLALIPYPFANLVFALNIPAWTVFFELAANAAHVLLLRRIGTAWLAALALVMLAVTAWLAFGRGGIDVGARPATFLAGFPRIFLAYIIGIVMGRLIAAPLGIPGWLGIGIMPGAIFIGWAFDLQSAWFDLGFVVLVCPLAILGGLAVTRHTRAGWLSGAISFPLFAIHLPILEGIRELGFGVRTAVIWAFAAALLIVWWTNRAALRKAASQA